jgi:hypothetical protein
MKTETNTFVFIPWRSSFTSIGESQSAKSARGAGEARAGVVAAESAVIER